MLQWLSMIRILCQVVKPGARLRGIKKIYKKTYKNEKQNKPAPRGAVNKPWRVRGLISEETHAFIVKKRLA